VRPDDAQQGPLTTRSNPGVASPLPPPRPSAPQVEVTSEPVAPVAPFPEPPVSEPAAASSAGPASEDSPDAWPEVEARTLELPRRKGGSRMVALTLLDGTSIQLPAKRRNVPAEDEERSPNSGPQFLGNMTARDLIKALSAVAEGADAREVFGEKAPLEAICAALLSLLLRKGLVADWEFVEELRKKP
jgi:hypothetical protein